MNITTQTCKGCGEEKDADAFFKDASRPSGLGTMCRACRKERYGARAAAPAPRVEAEDVVAEPRRERRSRSRAHTAELDRAINIAPTGRAYSADGPMRGAMYDRANICAECKGALRASDGHYHTRSARGYAGCEPTCCRCAKHEAA